MYKSLFHADISAPRHVILTIITERKRDLEKVYIHISLLTMTISLELRRNISTLARQTAVRNEII